EFFQERAGDLEGDDVLHDHAGGADGGDVGAFPARLGGFLGVQIDALQRLAQGADRLHRAADDDRFAVGHAAFEPAGVVRAPHDAETGHALLARVVADFIVDLRPRPARGIEAEAELDALERLDADHSRRDAAVEPAVPGHAAADADRAAK